MFNSWFNIESNIYLTNSIIAIIFLNVYIYIFISINIFLLFFNFNYNFLKTTNSWKHINITNYFKYSLICFLMSLSGLPPFLGFFIKFLYFVTLIKLTSWLFILIFLIFNLFCIFFYIQNFKYLNIDETNTEIFILKNEHFFLLNKNLIYFLNLFQFLNCFGVFYIEFFLNYFNFIISFFNF